MKVGLIGRGRLGQLIEYYLGQDVDLAIYEANQEHRSPTRDADLESVCQRPIVIAAVPISELESLLKEVSPLLAPGTLFIDVCSVKTVPINLMKGHLPESVQILGTHPMFGPDSAKKTLFGSKIVFCPERIEPSLLQQITLYLEQVGLNVITTTPEEHDRQISHSLLITHLVGRTLMDFKAESLVIDTKGYRRLMKILEVVENDSWQLFVDMIQYNPQASKTLSEFTLSLSKVLEKATEK